MRNVADSLWCYSRLVAKKGFVPFDTSSMLELSNRMQLDSRDDFMTALRKFRHAARDCRVTGHRSPPASLRARAGAVLVLLLSSCGLPDQSSAARLQSRKDLERELIPASSVITADPDWAIETWSARKTYTFETRMSGAEYRSWIERRLAGNWHCRIATDSRLAYSRLTPTEQHVLESRRRRNSTSG
jgi:hypothetical protein